MQGILQQKITKQSRNYNQASQEIKHGLVHGCRVVSPSIPYGNKIGAKLVSPAIEIYYGCYIWCRTKELLRLSSISTVFSIVCVEKHSGVVQKRGAS